MKWSLCTLLICLNSNAKAMQVDVAMDQDYYTSTENPLIDLKYTNNSKRTIKIPEKLVPSNEFWNDIFTLKIGDEKAKYIGKLYVHRPSGEIYKLKPGESVSYEIDLSKLYDLRKGGNYSIQACVRIKKKSYSSNIIEVFIEGRDNVETTNIISIQGMRTYKCSSTEINKLKLSFPKAVEWTTEAYTKLKNLPPNKAAKDKQYKKWFCKDKKKEKLFYSVRENWRGIKEAINTKRIKFHCGCTNAIAFVYPHKPYNIYVCKGFFEWPITGTNSQAGVIIHEMSHFYATASTRDYAYGEKRCKDLVKRRPEMAIRNADNYMYFCSAK